MFFFIIVFYVIFFFFNIRVFYIIGFQTVSNNSTVVDELHMPETSRVLLAALSVLMWFVVNSFCFASPMHVSCAKTENTLYIKYLQNFLGIQTVKSRWSFSDIWPCQIVFCSQLHCLLFIPFFRIHIRCCDNFSL